MRQWLFLSYLLDDNTPVYGGGSVFQSLNDKDINKGDSCNKAQWTLSNHIGTHIDTPRHFSSKGNTLDYYPADFWVFYNIEIIDISPVAPGHILSMKDLPIENLPRNTQLLLIKTCFSNLRKKSVYWQDNPGFHPNLANYLRDNFPKLRVLGFDLISLSSFAHRALGREAHKAFLDHPRPILILEDMDLSQVSNDTHFNHIIVAPLRVNGSDASPKKRMSKLKAMNR